MTDRKEIDAMEFSRGFLLVQGNTTDLRRMLIEEDGLNETAANSTIEQAQQWAAQARKKLPPKDSENSVEYNPHEQKREDEKQSIKVGIVQNGKNEITKDNLKYLLDLLDEAENLSYEACKKDSPGMEISKSLGCAIWMRAYEIAHIEIMLKIKYKDYSITKKMIESMVSELRKIRAENPSIRDYL